MQGTSIMTAASPLGAPQQMTLAGRPCQFPFYYRGVAQTSCVPYSSADSSAFCMDTDGRFGMCSPQPLSPYSTFQSWLDQWAGKGSLETAVSMRQSCHLSVRWLYSADASCIECIGTQMWSCTVMAPLHYDGACKKITFELTGLLRQCMRSVE